MHRSFYIFTWNLLNAFNGPSPAQPTGESGTNLTHPSLAGMEDLAGISGPCQECVCTQSLGEAASEGSLLEAQQSDLLFLFGKTWWLLWEGGDGKGQDFVA